MTENSVKMSESARKVLMLADGEARRLRHTSTGSIDILLGLLAEEEGGIAKRTLQILEIDINGLSDLLQADTLYAAEDHLLDHTHLKKILALAIDEATRLKQPSIGSEHLLLGLLREQEN